MKAIGTQNAWMEYSGCKNADYGVRMLSMPTRPHPARNGELKKVAGRDGKLFLDEGTYDRVLVTVRLIATQNNIDDVNAWLTGEGTLRFGDAPDRAYRATIVKEFAMSHRNPRLCGQEFTVTFDCEPFRYAYPEPEAVAFTSASGTIENPGTAAAQPRLKIECNSNFVLTINGYTIESKNLTADGVIVDCELQDCYDLTGAQNMNTYMIIDEYPVLSPGENAISWTGGITSLEITPRWRYL